MKKYALIAAALIWPAALVGQVTFRQFHDGNNQLFRVLDSNGTLIEYVYDLNGNPTAVNRSTIAPSALAILNILPQRGLPGQQMIIYGQNFSPTAAGDQVKINGVTATVLQASATQLIVTIPNGVTTGPVSVTVNGTTVTSGNLNFTVIGLPTITSITPSFGSIGQILTGVVIQGTNLDGATFDSGGAGAVSNVNLVSSTQATVTLMLGQTVGPYVFTANGNSGISSPVPTPGNTFTVFFPPGVNESFLRFSVFNTAYPPGLDPVVPAGSNEFSQRVSVFNTAYPPGLDPVVPTGSNEFTQPFSVFNTFFPAGINPYVPSGSNEAFQLFSTKNLGPGPIHSPALTLFGTSLSADALRIGNATAASPPTIGPDDTLYAGQTVRIQISLPLGIAARGGLEVNGAPLVAEAMTPIDTLFTVPAGVDSLTFQAVVRDFATLPATRAIRVVADAGRALSGQLLDDAGTPVANTAVRVHANGLRAHYYRFNGPLTEIPDLSGLTAARSAPVTAINMTNPNGVFGEDPLGIGLGRYAAARYRGRIRAERDGEYLFHLQTQSLARLRIDGQRLVEGASGSASISLSAGWHEIELTYVSSGGPQSLQLGWTRPGGTPAIVAPEFLQFEGGRDLTTTTDGEGRYSFASVPTILEGIEVKAVRN